MSSSVVSLRSSWNWKCSFIWYQFKIDYQFSLLRHLYLHKIAPIKSAYASLHINYLVSEPKPFRLAFALLLCILSILFISVNSSNVHVFYFWIFGNKLDLSEATCFIIHTTKWCVFATYCQNSRKSIRVFCVVEANIIFSNCESAMKKCNAK